MFVSVLFSGSMAMATPCFLRHRPHPLAEFHQLLPGMCRVKAVRDASRAARAKHNHFQPCLSARSSAVVTKSMQRLRC